jgi:hypothetical protein
MTTRTGISLIKEPSSLFLLTGMLAWAFVLPLLKRILPLPSLARLMWSSAGQGERRQEREEKIYAFARVIYGRFLTDSNCLERSLLLYRFLSQNHIDCQLVVGMNKSLEEWRGHAWVLVDGNPFGEPADSLQQYTPLFTFVDRGRMESSPQRHKESL